MVRCNVCVTVKPNIGFLGSNIGLGQGCNVDYNDKKTYTSREELTHAP